MTGVGRAAGDRIAGRLEEIAAAAGAGFDAAERRYREHAAAPRQPTRPESAELGRLRRRLVADAVAADTPVARLLLPADRAAARPGVRRR
ncbi:MAG: hypothetical protein WBA05_12095 [Gordonia sp. (in: high G+C Gram-positive bacteria)]|uniref:hypothetical protein n=1 Tax=Gordonia sp. (in: high G+C Gram-positive bacteria) TaxID=84139 RepID=UPI003C748657